MFQCARHKKNITHGYIDDGTPHTGVKLATRAPLSAAHSFRNKLVFHLILLGTHIGINAILNNNTE